MPETRSEKVGGVMALVALYLFCLSIGPSTAGVNLSLGLLLLATMAAARPFWSDVKRLPLFWLMAVFLVYVVIQSLVHVSRVPDLADSGNPHWTHVARTMGLFSLPMAWWISRFPKHIPWLLATAGVSLALGILYAIDLAGIVEHGFWQRRYWGSRQGEVSYLAAAGLIGCWLIAVNWFFHAPLRSRLVLLNTPVFSVLGLMFLIALYGSQTRSTWGAAAVVLVTIVAFHAVTVLREGQHRARMLVVVAFMAGAVILALSVDGGAAFQQRLGGQSDTLRAVLAMDPEAIMQANRPLGLRVQMWMAGVEAFAQRPLFGWGLGGMKQVSAALGVDLGGHAHFHNAYLELLVGLGVVGFLLFIALVYVLCRDALRDYRRGDMGRRMPLGLAGAVLFMTALTLLFEIRFGHTSGRSLMILVIALLATAQWGPVRARNLSRSQNL